MYFYIELNELYKVIQIPFITPLSYYPEKSDDYKILYTRRRNSIRCGRCFIEIRRWNLTFGSKYNNFPAQKDKKEIKYKEATLTFNSIRYLMNQSEKQKTQCYDTKVPVLCYILKNQRNID